MEQYENALQVQFGELWFLKFADQQALGQFAAAQLSGVSTANRVATMKRDAISVAISCYQAIASVER